MPISPHVWIQVGEYEKMRDNRVKRERKQINMQGLILEGTTEDSVRLSNNIELVADLSPRQVRVEIHAAGVCGSD